MKKTIEYVEELLADVTKSNRECEDLNDPVSVSYSNGLEEGISWVIEKLKERYIK
jgi:hypothetical protein